MLIGLPSLLAAQLPDRRDLRRHDGELRRRLGKVDFVPGVSVRFPGLLERRIAFMFRASKYRRFQSFFDDGERFMATETWIKREIAQGLARAKKADLNEIVVSPKSTGLHWPKLDAGLTVAGLLARKAGGRG